MRKSQDDIEETFRLYYRPLCLYAIHYLGDVDASEDVVQDCFAELWQRMDVGNAINDLKHYLYVMVKNRCFDRIKKSSVIDHDVKPSDLAETISDDEAVDRSEQEARLWTAIDALPEKRREIFLMSKRDGMKYMEIANRLGISENTVENQMSKALKTLRDGVKKIYNFFFA